MKEDISENYQSNIEMLSTDEMVDFLCSDMFKSIKKIKQCSREIAEAIDLVSQRFLKGGSLYIYSTGTAARIAAAEALEAKTNFALKPDILQTFILGGGKAFKDINFEPDNTYNAGETELLLSIANEKDVVMLIETPSNCDYIKGAAETAKRRKIATVVLVFEGDEIQCTDVKISIPKKVKKIPTINDTNYSCLQKIILHLVISGVMVKIGKVYENFIIDPNVSKNKKIAQHLVMKFTGENEKTVKNVLEQCGYHSKIAIVMLKKQTDLKTAVEIIKANNGHLKGIVE